MIRACDLGKLLMGLAVVLLIWAGVQGGDVVDVEDAEIIDITLYEEALREIGRPPVEYVVSKFAEHDVVMLGENHGVRENCELVAALIEPIYRLTGVRHFVTEFVRSSNTQRTNRLVTDPTFDRDLAIDIMRDNAWPTWGYEEYLAILEAVWRLNSALPPDAEPMRVIGLDSDWSQHDLLFKHAGKRAAFDMMRGREAHMVQVFVDQVLEPGHKALAHMGYAHSVTCQGERLGTVLYRSYGDRLFQVCLHHPFSSPTGPSSVSTLIERIVAQSGREEVGFDVAGTPFARLRDPDNMAFSFGGERALGDLAQGYVFLRPVEELSPVTWIDGFIDEGNFREALDVTSKMGQADPKQHDTPAKLDARLKEVTESR